MLRVLMIVIGASVMTAACALEWFGVGEAGFGGAQQLMVLIGAVYAVWGLLIPRLPAAGIGLSVMAIMIFVCVCLAEVTGHASGYDFNFADRAWRATPIYYRQPIEPVGNAYFRRPGPDVWRGTVLTAMMQKINATETDAYPHESPLKVHYDEFGFRNPTDLQDWNLVFVGDSFTEIGYLPYEHLVSTQVGRLLGRPVKNLGVSYTGTLTHNCYLSEYGKSPNTSDAFLCFFEGNDIDDMLLEAARRTEFETTGVRSVRDISQYREPSFLRAVSRAVSARFPRAVNGTVTTHNADFVVGSKRTRVSALYHPPNESDLTESTKELIESALAEWAQTAVKHDIKPWFVFMPVKRRVLGEFLEFRDNAPVEVVNWSPSDLPQYLQRICGEHGIEFINVTDVLMHEARQGVLTYNTLWDTHLN
ncbi:MAG: hypothetical protein O3A00_16835, partial [Planctomycetota bacterium]|nr:hypothetical protein [Planctomycetota bacterium]